MGLGMGWEQSFRKDATWIPACLIFRSVCGCACASFGKPLDHFP